MKTTGFPKPEVVRGSGGQDATCNGHHWTWERTNQRTTLWHERYNEYFQFERFIESDELCELIQIFEIGRILGKNDGIEAEKNRIRNILRL